VNSNLALARVILEANLGGRSGPPSTGSSPTAGPASRSRNSPRLSHRHRA